MKPTLRSALVVAGTIAAVTAGMLPASAAPSYEGNKAGNGQSLEPFYCSGLGDLLIRTNGNNSSEMGGWGTAKIVEGGSGTLIPTSFTFEAYDATKEMDLFPSQTLVKGGGHANGQQDVLDCSSTMTGTLEDFAEPGDELPSWAEPSDKIVVTFSATAVLVP